MLFLFITNCKNNKTEEVSIVNNEKKIIVVENDNNSCDEILYKIVESSELDLRGVKDYFVRIESIESDTISIQVYSKKIYQKMTNKNKLLKAQ